jgi:hypothetical protein
MANCVNTNTKEFKELSAEAKLNPVILAAKVSLWQESNGLDNFPSLGDLRVKEFNSVKGFFQPDYFNPEGTVKTSDLLSHVAESSHPLFLVAKHLEKYSNLLDKSTSSLVTDEDMPNASGTYFPNTHNISINSSTEFINGGVTILHEVLHAMSYRELRSNTANAKNFQELYDHVKPLFEEYNKETREGTYATYTVDEFMVAIHTDSKFIKALQEIPALEDTKFKNAYEEIMDYLLSLLGITKEKDSSIYAQAFFAAETILKDANERLESNEEYQKLVDDGYIPFSMKEKPKLGTITANGISSLLGTTFQTKRFSNTVSFNQGKAIKKYNALQSDHKLQYTSKLENANTGEHSFTYTVSAGKALQQGTVPTQFKLFPETIEENNEGLTEETKTERDLDYYNGDEALYTQEEISEPENIDLIDGKTVEQVLEEDYTEEENKEIEEIQNEVSEMNSIINKILAYEAELARVKETGAILATTEFGGQVKVSFTSVAQAEDYFRSRLKELEQQILEEGENAIANASTPVGVTQPHYEAYLKQKEAMLVHVESSLKNLYAQKNEFKSTKFDNKIQEFRNLKDNLVSDIFDFNKPGVDKLNLVERFFKEDVETVSALLKNPTLDNYFLAKDLLDFMKRISDPTKEGDIEKNIGNVMTPYLNRKAFYSAEVLEMLKKVRALTDKADVLVKDAGESVLMELLERHESKLMSIYKTDSLEDVRQQLKKQLKDITKVESYLMATGENLIRENNILDALMRLEYEVEENKVMAAQTAIKTKISIAEAKGEAALKAIGETYSLFIKPGKYADKIIEKFTEGYTSFTKAIKIAVDSKIYEAIKAKDWLLEQQLLTQKFNLLNNDTEFIDIGLLHELENGSGSYAKYKLGTALQATVYKAELINKIGQIEYNNILETQRNNLDAFHQDLANYKQYKLDQEGKTNINDLSPESQKNITIFETRNNPLKFVENYKLNGGNMVAYSIGTQANTTTAKLTYNTYIPRKVDLQGNTTDYFDTQFDKIANNPDILALYTAIREGVYHTNDSLRGSGIFLSAGNLPSFKKTMTDILLEKGWLGAIKQGLPTSLPEVLKVLKSVVTLKPIRTALGRNLSGTSVEYGEDNDIETPLGISFDNKGDNKTNLATVVKAALEISAVHKARTLAKDKVRFYMEESKNIKDPLGKDRENEMARQKYFYNNVLLNKKGKKQYGDISKKLIAIDKKFSGKKFNRARMFYKFFTAEQKETYKFVLKAWNDLNKRGIDNLNEKELEDLASYENTMNNLGSDYFLSTVYQGIALKLAVSVNLISNPVAQIFNKSAGWAACRNRDGKYWPKGSFYKCNSFLHKKPMMKLVSEEWKEQAKILRIFTERMALINDGTSELERAEGRLKQEFSVVYPMGLMKWAEDSNQTLGILCMATGHKIKDVNGNEFPLFTGSKFNGYIIKDGNLELSPEFDTPENRKSLIDMSSDSILDWKGDTKETLNELNGDYSHTGVTRIKGNVLTAPFMLYKTWLPKFIGSRWRTEQKNIRKGTIEKGFMLEAITGKTSGSSGIMLASTVALGALYATNPAIPLSIAAILAGVGVVNNLRGKSPSLVEDEDEIVVTWKKQANFVLQTLLRTPATPINMIAGRELIEGSEKYLGLNESKLNEKTSALAARDVARNLQYSLAVVAFNLAIQAAFGPPDEEEEKKGAEGSLQRKRWIAQQERKREEHPYFNFAVNASERLLQETNTCLDPTILATTFGSKNTMEGSFDKLNKALQAWARPEEEDIIKSGSNAGQSKTSQFLRGAFLPAGVRQLGAEGGFEDVTKGWKAGFETFTEKELSKDSWSKDKLRTTDFKKASEKYKAELTIKMPIAQENILKSWKYESVDEIPVETMSLFKKQVKLEAAKIIRTENLDRDLEDKIFVPRRGKFDKEQMKNPKK